MTAPCMSSSPSGGPSDREVAAVPVLSHEHFAQGLAKGLTGKAAYVEATYRGQGHVGEAFASSLDVNMSCPRRLSLNR